MNNISFPFQYLSAEDYPEDNRRVRYEDGDEEDLSLAELKEIVALAPNEFKKKKSSKKMTPSNKSKKKRPAATSLSSSKNKKSKADDASETIPGTVSAKVDVAFAKTTKVKIKEGQILVLGCVNAVKPFNINRCNHIW